MSFDRARLKLDAARLAAQGVYIGSSSWKYQGWFGQLYNPSRYEYRGKVATTRFERLCLAEYAEVFKTVSVDAAYYTFPSVPYLEGLAGQVPSDFKFAFKVTDEITVNRFPNLPRFGARAGQTNPNFLNADLFDRAFLAPCKAICNHVGLLMFEFSRFHQADFAHGRDFVAALDPFLAALPPGWPYGIEMRNKQWLQPEYFECLARHNVTHVFNSWTMMPPVPEQMEMPGSRTRSDLLAARFLLKPGRTYEKAVEAFQPYDRTHEVNEEARLAGAILIREGLLYLPRKKVFIYVNNRLEGNALWTIKGMLEALDKLIPTRPGYPPYALLPGAQAVLRNDVKEYPLPAGLTAGEVVTVIDVDTGTYQVRSADGNEHRVPSFCVERQLSM